MNRDNSHPKNKGKFNGTCNRTACGWERDVIFYNRSTQAYYCPRCAKAINDTDRQELPLCIPHQVVPAFSSMTP